MLNPEMYEAIKAAKERIRDMDYTDILTEYLRHKSEDAPNYDSIAFMNVVGSGTFIDQTWRGEFCLSFEMPSTRTVPNLISGNRITIMFKHLVDSEFEIDQTVSFDLRRMINDVERAEALKKIIGEFNMNGLLRALLGGDDDE